MEQIPLCQLPQWGHTLEQFLRAAGSPHPEALIGELGLEAPPGLMVAMNARRASLTSPETRGSIQHNNFILLGVPGEPG